eukprot:gene34893-45152_t
MAALVHHFVGIDVGSQKTMMIAEDAEIILTDTGSVAFPTIFSYTETKLRLFGEEAAAQLSESTVSMINLLATMTEDKISEFLQKDVLSHSKTLIKSVTHDSSKRLALTFDDQTATKQCYINACLIAGIAKNAINVVDSSDCLVATYSRKLAGLIPVVQSKLVNQPVVLIDIGHTKSTVIVVLVESNAEGLLTPRKLAVTFNAAIGAYFFDLILWEHFAKKIEVKTKSVIEKGSKRGIRLLSACERLRKLLSQLPSSQVTVENMSDDYGDETLQISRDEMSSLCEESLLKPLQELISAALVDAKVPAADVYAVEALGGGMRMPIIQSLVLKIFSGSVNVTSLGAKFDDGSVALGAALFSCTQSAAITSDGSTGDSEQPLLNGYQFSDEELAVAIEKEKQLQQKDEDCRAFLAAKNSMESFILEMRMAPQRKFGETINSSELNQVLDENEGWLWDHSDDATLEEINSKSNLMRSQVETICAIYLQKVSEEKKLMEKQLDEEAEKAAAERAANGEEEEDHDNRKLRKADRMKLVVKNKEEGTELFKGKNFRHAAARYQKALSHCAKFFDLSGEDEAEVKALKLSLYLNLATCYIKLEVWEQVIRNCEDALSIDSANVKAIFRRSTYFEHKKEWEKAMADIKKCQELTKDGPEDVLVTKAFERVKKEQQKEKDKEKKMWGKAFS